MIREAGGVREETAQRIEDQILKLYGRKALQEPGALWSRVAIIAWRRNSVNSAELISPDAIPNSR